MSRMRRDENAVKEFLGKYKIKEKDGSKADQLGTLYAAAYFSFKPDWHNEKGKYDASNAKDGLGNMTKEVYEMGGLFANALSSMYGQKFTQTVRDASVLLAIHVAQANHRVKQLYQKVKEPGRKAGDVDGTDVSRLNALGVNDFMNVVGTRESKIPTPSQIYPLLMLLYPSDFTYTGQMARNEENRKALENYFKK